MIHIIEPWKYKTELVTKTSNAHIAVKNASKNIIDIIKIMEINYKEYYCYTY